jgi:hypothetical protein
MPDIGRDRRDDEGDRNRGQAEVDEDGPPAEAP